ncbi:hypothetical protein DL764_003473 [Monosporascus ibericus]|uniref:Uncharacterized protein n=1 Tax=Monosporascus ibericus TaxID=155417 RepID=A0A4V1XBE2_9PEZI|nr:hypothetical protein DL764_003473 [Monosporascus ibericus]
MAGPERQREAIGPPRPQCPVPIAIIGMGCRWPGGVCNPSQLWELMKDKRDGWAEFVPDRMNVNGFYHPNGQRPGSMVTKGGFVLQEDPRHFDHSFFGITATEAMSMDPSQRKLLEVTYDAFESAGEPFENFFGSRTGVFVGNFNNEHQLMQMRDPDHTLPYGVTGGGPTILSNRINHTFNLQGPSLMVDTACSASMYALHLAVLSLRNDDCDAAIVAGANLILGPDHQILTTKLGAASPTSRCHTFDASADGYARAEGFGAIYLKRLPDALAQGDPIRAVVRGTAFNANGKTGGITHPSPEGQEAVIRQAYKVAGDLDPNLTGYFECHGTGTPVGDPIEVSAVGKVFASGRQDEPLLIGSIKPNLGHSEAASAMAQIMKGVLALEHGEIPATIGIEKLNPAIDFEKERVQVVTEITPWPSDKLRRISINSFGYGGANAHCILDHPSLVVPRGHLREIAAAYAAGRLRASEAIVLAYTRGRIVTTNERKGLMMAVGLSPNQISPYLGDAQDDVKIAAVNSPESITLSGEHGTIEELATKLTAREIFNRILDTGENAYHSHHMLTLGQPYEELATQGIREIEPAIQRESPGCSVRWISSVTPEEEVESRLPRYWRRNLESPVLFSQAVQVLAREEPVDLLIEIGPHPALGTPLKQIRSVLEQAGLTLPPCVPSLRRGENDVASMLRLAGTLFMRNAPIDLVAVNATERIRNGKIYLQHGVPCPSLPQYNFSYPKKPVYFENRFSKEYRTRQHLRHDLLGARQPGGSRSRPSWRNVLRMKDLPWLEDHKILPHAVLPAAAYIAMAVEAVSQVHWEAEDAAPIKSFKLRNVAVNSTLRIEDTEFGVETVLDMHRVPLTNSGAVSRWYQFSIGSMGPDSGGWTEHCTGTISISTEQTTIDKGQWLQADTRSRSLDIRRWYDKFREVGLGYGPAFQGLSSLQAYRGSNSAAANVLLNPTVGAVHGGESDYAVHPATMDACIQLALISCHAGQVENAEKAFVPIAANDMSIWVPESFGEQGRGVASGKLVGLRGAYARAQLCSMSGAPILDIGELRCISYDGISETRASSMFTRGPYWRPVARVDIGTLPKQSTKEMFRSTGIPYPKLDAFDRFCTHALAAIEAMLPKITSRGETQIRGEFADWIHSWTRSGLMQKETLGPNAEEMVMTMKSLGLELSDVPEVRCIQKLCDDLDMILGEETNIAKLQMEENILQQLYASGITMRGAYRQLQQLVDLLAHKNPRMRILEVGAGTGRATAFVLDTLASKTAFRRFQEYRFTDRIASRLSDARDRFKGHTGIFFQELDIQRDPVSQRFQPHSYDLIIAAGSFVEVDDIARVLWRLRTLLKPKGTLALAEVTRPRLGSELLSRALAERWTQGQLVRSEAAWCHLLEKCGFSGVDIALDDYDGDQATSTVMLSTPADPVEHLEANANQEGIYLVYRDSPPLLADAIDKALKETRSYAIYTELLAHEEIPEGSTVIALVDYEDVTLLSRGGAHFEAIQAVLTRASTVVWIAGGDAATGPGEPSIMKGMLRSVANENVLSQIVFIEMERSDPTSQPRTAELIMHKLSELRSSTSCVGVDRECVLRNGALYVERLLPDNELNEQFRLRHGFEDDVQERPMHSQGPLRANYLKNGLLSSLYFSRDSAFSAPLKDDWAEIMVKADLAVATARFDLDNLSTEAAGVVTQLGPTVTSLKVGDRVFGLIPGNMGNYARSPASLLSRIPDGESFDGAASMPVAYLTSLYALRHLARLTKGESVLIQSATGGLGMAAIRIARHLGAEIYATVGNDEKKKILVEGFAIPAYRIFNSRHLTTVDDIMQATERHGIDVILSSCAGDLMHETWRCIAPLGRFIDIGRVDVLGRGKLGLEVFQRNATFSSFDMGLLYRQKPALIERLMNEMIELYHQGTIRPIDPITTFDISKLQSAMTFFSKAVHIGKIVITFHNPEATLKADPAKDTLFNKAHYSQIHRVLAPKVKGTVNLHHATKHLPLDFFLMTSSIIGTIGTATQGAYTAANAFQDAFARFRLAQSLPATSLGVGVILEVGSLRNSVRFQQMLRRNATYAMSETEFLQLLEGVLCQSSLTSTNVSSLSKLDPSAQAQVVTGLEPARFMPYVEGDRMNELVWHDNARFQAIIQAVSDRAQARTSVDSSTSGSRSPLTRKLQLAPSPTEKPAIVREAVIERLAELLDLTTDDIDAEKPISQYGVDSLIAAELRSWLNKTFGSHVTLLQLLSKGTRINDLVNSALLREDKV